MVAAHRVVMVTLRVQLSGNRGSTLLLGTTPQAHLSLMSLIVKVPTKVEVVTYENWLE